jgi:hypothetical protein
VVLATSNQPLGKMAGLTVRLDLIGGVLAVLVVAIALLARRPLPTSLALLAFAGFVVCQLLSSLANRGVWPPGVKFSLIYVLALAFVCAVLMLVRDLATARWALTLLVAIAVVQATVSAAAVLGHHLFGPPLPAAAPPRLFYRAEGAMSEANLFASLLLVPFAVALWRWAGAPRAITPAGAACLALSAGLVFALTRAAWIASIMVTWWSPLRRRAAGRRFRWLVGAVAAAAALLLASDLVFRHGAVERTGLYDRLLTGILTSYDEPLDARREEARASVASWRTAPWFGHGAGSAKTLKQYFRHTRHLRPEPWLSNATLFILHDSGLVGLALFAGAVGAAGHRWSRAAGLLGEPAAERDHAALGVGLAATLLAWQATHGLWQMHGYLSFGLLLALNGLARPRSVTPR